MRRNNYGRNLTFPSKFVTGTQLITVVSIGISILLLNSMVSIDEVAHCVPLVVISAPVFMPVRSNKPLTEVSEFKFNVDSRALERAEFDKKVL
jgi:hypothetical protein